jgi:drug/metabolite transporter (DMT)-like permease
MPSSGRLLESGGMQPWLLAALAGGVFVGAHYMLLRAASGKLGDTLGAFVLEGTAALGILVAYFVLPRGAPVATTRAGVLFSVASGLCISAVSILLFYALRKGGPVASTGTLVLGGGVTLSALCAPMFFGEPFTPRRALGVFLGICAIFVLSGEGKTPDPTP